MTRRFRSCLPLLSLLLLALTSASAFARVSIQNPASGVFTAAEQCVGEPSLATPDRIKQKSHFTYELASDFAVAARGTAGASKDIFVIGRQVDTAVAKSWPGHKVLDISNWTLAKNDAWVKGIIDQRAKVYIGSPETRATLWDAANSRSTVFGRELQQFLDAGYKRAGDYLLPP